MDKTPENPQLNQTIEALLFVSTQPLSLKDLMRATKSSEDDVRAAIEVLRTKLRGRGVRLFENHNTFHLATAPEQNAAIERYLATSMRTELSKPALETLAIVAYKQPVTKGAIEAIRGVSSEQTIRNLLLRGLITEAGQSDTPGKPTLYRTSMRFLQHLGIQNIDEMATLDDLSAEGSDEQ
jgi:segregation and condensation protein B